MEALFERAETISDRLENIRKTSEESDFIYSTSELRTAEREVELIMSRIQEEKERLETLREQVENLWEIAKYLETAFYGIRQNLDEFTRKIEYLESKL